MRILTEALTFDDVSLVPAYSNVLPRDVSLATPLTRGIRLNIPRLGPLRLDYGIPIKHPNNESKGKFQFSVGFTRDY